MATGGARGEGWGEGGGVGLRVRVRARMRFGGVVAGRGMQGGAGWVREVCGCRCACKVGRDWWEPLPAPAARQKLAGPLLPDGPAPLALPSLPLFLLECSKGGNNNTYCHDSELNWLDWEQAERDQFGLARFVRHMIGLRWGVGRGQVCVGQACGRVRGVGRWQLGR